MPAVYVSGTLSFDVTLPDDKNHKWTFGQWTDKKLAKQRAEYEHPAVSIELRMENEDEPICPFVLYVSEKDAYEGALTVTQKGRVFSFAFSGKFKADAHKDTKAQIDAGRRPKLQSVSINGTGYGVPTPIDVDWVIQSKKIR